MKYILFILFFFCPCLGFAQIDNVLAGKNRADLTGSETRQVFSGQPVILIEKGEDDGEKPVRTEVNLPPPNLMQNDIELEIKTPFSHVRQASFIDHTTDWVSYIQVLDSETIQVTEEIQFITTQKDSIFKRTFVNRLTDKEGRNLTPKRQFLSVKRDGENISVQVTEDDNTTVLSDTKALSVGVHKYTIQYLISDVLTRDASVADMVFSVTGDAWPLPIERLTVLVTFPKRMTIYTREFLFGTNNQSIPENGRAMQDITGVVLYQTTHPLPAYADVRIHMVLDARQIPAATKDIPYDVIIGGGYLLVLAFYVFLSIMVCRYRRWKNVLLSGRKINPFLWRSIISFALSADERRSAYTNVIEQQSQLNRFPWVQYILAFLRFNKEYILGILLLMFGLHFSAAYRDTSLSPAVCIFVIGCSLAGLMIIHYFGTRIELLRLRRLFADELLSAPRGLNLAPRDIPPYFIRAVCLGFGSAWADRLIANNPAYRKLDFLQGRENE